MDSPARIAYWIDLDDPRAPSQEIWDRMSPEERELVAAGLPSELAASQSMPPEGDAHFDAKVGARQALENHFALTGRSIYIACELPVYYPGEPMFAPDVMAVLDADLGERSSWLVSKEGRGLDLALEIHVHGDRRKDLDANVERYARLGIREYFIFDRGRLALHGYRLATADARAYQPIEPDRGVYTSEVLGLQLRIESTRLRFLQDGEPVLELEEYAELLERRVVRQQVQMHMLLHERDAAVQRAREADKRLAEALAALAGRGDNEDD